MWSRVYDSAKVGRAQASLLLIEQTVNPISSAEAERIFADEHRCYRLQVEVISRAPSISCATRLMLSICLACLYEIQIFSRYFSSIVNYEAL